MVILLSLLGAQAVVLLVLLARDVNQLRSEWKSTALLLGLGGNLFAPFVGGFLYALWWIAAAVAPRLAQIVNDSSAMHSPGPRLPSLIPDQPWTTVLQFWLAGWIAFLACLEISCLPGRLRRRRGG